MTPPREGGDVARWRYEFSDESYQDETGSTEQIWVWAIFDGPIDPDDIVLTGTSYTVPDGLLQAICATHNRGDLLP